MKVLLVVTLLLMGQEKPTQNVMETKDLKQCEVQAHDFMTHKFPDEVQRRIRVRSAACAFALPGQDT